MKETLVFLTFAIPVYGALCFTAGWFKRKDREHDRANLR